MKMKKISILAMAFVMVGLVACNSKKEGEAAADNAVSAESEAIAQRDSLLILYNDIYEGMAQIKELEMIVSTPGSGETVSQKEQIKNDMMAIQQALQERRQRLAELEQSLSNSTGENTLLRKTIKSLNEQIAAQEQEIASLSQKLKEANVQIAELSEENTALNTQVNNLNTAVENEQRERKIAEEESENLSKELNTCYYALGSKSELEKNGILESKFLRKTKIMQGDYNIDYFTKADKRTLTTINTHSKKVEVMTNQPKDSYTITEVNKEKIINITDPVKFWSLGNYLIVKIN